MNYNFQLVDNFPTEPGVYIMKNIDNMVIYVGKAKNLKQRVKQYFVPGRDQRAMIPFLLKELSFVETLIVYSEKEALLLENTLIKKHKPKYNVLLKDDKTYGSLVINNDHPWPDINLVRHKSGFRSKKGLFFGPYTNGFAARQTLELIHRLFPLRQCSDEELKKRSRPCLLYSIKKCLAPCMNKCSPEDYNLFVQGAIKFLKGESKEVLKKLYQQMEEASEALAFEKAEAILKTIRQIEHVTLDNQLVVQQSLINADVIGLYRQGTACLLTQLFFREGKLSGSDHHIFDSTIQEEEEILESFIMQNYQNEAIVPEEILLPIKIASSETLSEILPRKCSIYTPLIGPKKALIHLAEKNAKHRWEIEQKEKEDKEMLLSKLQDVCQLHRYPRHIECIDISNLSGTQTVGAIISYIDGVKATQKKRLFNIKEAKGGDDYGALREVLQRRLKRAKEDQNWPDLIIVDGGKGQLNAAAQIFEELDILHVELISLVKDEGKHTKGITAERIFVRESNLPINLSIHDPLLFFLQTVRDEAHRCAITFQRQHRSKKMIKSALDDIKGIGVLKRQRLLQTFGSVQKIKEASKEDLKKVKGISDRDIESLSSL
ncbi:MAG: excinuclease ABC subunit UvrC [Rhabdochlamydiaceae bacterium]